MGGIEIKRDLVIFYGNTAGFINGDQATVDPIFRCDELEAFLRGRYKVDWQEGLFERLTAQGDNQVSQPVALRCRVWQLRREADPRLKFTGYAETVALIGQPRRVDYEIAYEGEAGSAPELRISDVLEIDGRCYFAGRRDVQEIPFQ